MAPGDARTYRAGGRSQIAADPRRGVLVLFGGGREGFVCQDVWERTPTGNWTFVADNMPTPPGQVRYDARRGNLFSIGVNARWDYRGGAWEQQPVAPVDGLVTSRFIEYDAGRGVGVLFEQDHLVNGLRSNSGAVWELGDDGWQQVTPRTPRSRSTAEMVWDDARGEAIMFGGFSGGLNRSYNLQFDPDPSTWTCRDGVWTEHAVPGPSPRMNFAMVYDTRRAVSVVFGGRTPGTETLAPTDVWEWDGQAWTRIVAPGLAARSRHAAVYDSARGVTVVFGGQNASAAPLADTWEWDGETWTRRDLLGPTARARPMMAYDATRRKTVLFGGVTSLNRFQNDTWEYDGVVWSRCNAPGPSPRVGCSMEFDPERNVVVLWGGVTETATLQETWEWDGAAWTLRDDMPMAVPRSFQAAAYDSRRHAMTAFGGNFVYDGSLFLGSLNNELWTLQADCPAPVISHEPEPAAACIGGVAEFTIIAEDASSLRYQWRHNMARIEGATGASLRIESASPSSAGFYDCLVTRDGDCAAARTISTPATLTVCVADYDCDGFISPFDYAMFVQAFEAGEADLNGDQFVDFFDYDVFVAAFERGC